MATVRQQPPWQSPPDVPSDIKSPPLKIYNSLTRSKNLFLPIDAKSRKVTWYACGPTVYDDAHLGHARNYVSTDIIRRIMKDYFKYDVKFVMNITDVDDKIIVRGRQQYLLGEYLAGRLEQHHPSAEARREALEAYVKKNLPRVPDDTPLANMKQIVDQKYADVLAGKSLDPSRPAGDEEAKIKMHIKTVLAASKAMISLEKKELEENSEDFQNNVQDILLPYLDAIYGSSIDASNHSIFTKLTQKFEARFMEDVRALNCLDPDEVTRVTEYGPQIVDFVRKIEDNEFAYKTSDGSVYFDIKAFEDANNSYARLEPGSRNDQGRQAEGEGNLTQRTTEKRSPSDFALWKSSRPGEPSWPSPWGQGRPGWHIECSAMASDKLGPQIDIHSGGVDLAFPHHDNELAQSEAYWLRTGQHNHQWVNYFMHMGHLSIQGSKMSKSLKNFVTIREALSRGTWTPRGLRIVFLLGYWAGPIEITEDLIREGSFWEDKLNVSTSISDDFNDQ
ncbi:cysteine--tRNA ligase [Physcia stellaris]|nr:cysteine--tRNA ligase [Physcia stellaris]